MNEYDDFDVNEFVKYLNQIIKNLDPNIYVYVGNKDVSYDVYGDNVVTLVDKSILKGIKVKYKNKVYEYCITY